MSRSLFFIYVMLLPFIFYTQTATYDKNTYTIYALKFGERTNYVRMEDQAVGDKSGDSTKVFFMYWLLKGKDNGKIILVDAGFTDDAEADPKKITFTSPEKLLSTVNVKPEEITDIVITHPHWDHIGGIDLYPKAMVWMQEEDYNDFVKKRKDPEAIGFKKKDIQKILDRKTNGSLTLINMHGKKDQVILPAVTVFSGSKHTAGSQFVMANNGKQNVILASDNCKYYRNVNKLLSSPATSDQKAYVQNLRNMKAYVLDTDLVIPGHDPLVFDKFKSVGKDVVEIKK